MAAAAVLGLRAYARHRKELGLPGQTHAAVRKAIDSGRLSKSVSYDNRRRVQIDPELADREWAGETDPVQQREPESARGRFSDDAQGALFPDLRDSIPPEKGGGDDADAKGPSIRKAQAVRVSYQAQLAALEFKEKSGQLTPVAAVKAEAFRLGRVVRDRILNVPDRIAAQLAAETDQHVCRSLLTRELTDALEELVDAGRRS